jgi:hypothetical protein
MRTYFRKLNERLSNDFDWLDISKNISDSQLKKIVEGAPMYIKDMDPDLKIFYNINYKSPIIAKLKKEKINIKEHYIYYDIIPEEKLDKIKNIFTNSLYEYLIKSVYDIVDFSKIKNVDEDIVDSSIREYIFISLIHKFCLYFLNKDKKTSNYVLYMIDGGGKEFSYSYTYSTANEINSFGIKDGDLLSKEHLIEYGKELCRFHNNNIFMYSGYFDDL